MSQEINLKPLAIALGAVFVTTLAAVPAANAAENPFAMSDLSSGYMVADDTEGKCGEGKMGKMKEGKCGEGKMDKAKEGKCGEGKCGGNKMKNMDKEKMKEGKCGSSKMDKMKEGNMDKAKEGKCGGSK